MKKRQIFILMAVGVVALGIFTARTLIGMRKAPERKSNERIARVVSAVEVKNDTVPLNIPVNGKLRPEQKVEIFPEVSGILLKPYKPFKVGQTYEKGEVMLRFDGSESLLNLISQRSAFAGLVNSMLPDIKLDYPDEYADMQQFFNVIEPNEALPPHPNVTNTKFEGFLTSRNFFQQYYSIRSAEQRQSKFEIRAPFKGVLTMGDLNEGTLIRLGQKLGEFIAVGHYEFETAVPVDMINELHVGDEVYVDYNGGTIAGNVHRISGNIDPATQRVLVYSKLFSTDLKDGMYLDGHIRAGTITGGFRINRNLILNDQVFLVEDTLLTKATVQVAHYESEIAVVKGLEDGSLLLDQVLEGAFEGMYVKAEVK